MSSDVLLRLSGAAKTYPTRRQPGREMMSHLLGLPRSGEHRHALHPIDLEVRRGESVGIVGLNGAGKSTLLQLAAGVLSPSEGSVAINGRVAALLELGSGFNPEATGLENIYLYSATLGMPRTAVQAQLDDIIDFSGLRESIEAPVKTYSSGMQVRLAFSVATAVQPDVLIVDEALSVGDGVFAKRSFDRIMALRETGTALLLCSHALFHVDLFCHRTLWLHRGSVRAAGPTKEVMPRYQEFMDQQSGGHDPSKASPVSSAPTTVESPPNPAGTEVGSAQAAFALAAAEHPARLIAAHISLNGTGGTELCTVSGQGTVQVDFEIQASADEPAPRAAVVLSSEMGRILGSSLSPQGAFKSTDASGRGRIRFEWQHPQLVQGRYRLGVYLLCTHGHYVYAWSDPHAQLVICHEGPHQGAFILPGRWSGAESN